MNAIVCVLRTGCQWNALDATGICSCGAAYRRFREWTDAGVFESLWRAGLLAYDPHKGWGWAWLSRDGAMSKAPLSGSKNRQDPDGSRQAGRQEAPPYGRFRHSARGRDRWCQPSRHDPGQGPARIDHGQASAPHATCAEGLGLDKGYDYDDVRDLVKAFGFTAHMRARGEAAIAIKQKASFKARRWVVERTHSWLNRCRRVLIRWEKRADTYIAMLHFACAIIT